LSLIAFQRALCDLIASPDLCLAVRANAAGALASYDLSARECGRLAALVWQRGMSTNCTLYRSNRVTPIYTLLPFTCRSLGSEFQPLMSEFWRSENYKDGQFKSEIDRFGAFLRSEISAGSVASPFAGELLEFELARNSLEFSRQKKVLRELENWPPLQADEPCQLHPLARLVPFQHEPEIVIGAVAQGDLPPDDLPEVKALLVLSIVDGDLTVLRLTDRAEYRYDTASSARTAWASPRVVPELAERGLLISYRCQE
jgi:hypothetical protein